MPPDAGELGLTHQVINHNEYAGFRMLNALVIAIYFDTEPLRLAGIHFRIASSICPRFCGPQNKDPGASVFRDMSQMTQHSIVSSPVGGVEMVVVEVNACDSLQCVSLSVMGQQECHRLLYQ